MMNETKAKPPMMRTRHPKQRFDPDADFVFRKRLRLGAAGIEWAERGDPFPKEELEKARPGITRRFWRAKAIELADFVPPDRRRLPPHAAAVTLKPGGGGWWHLDVAGSRTEPLRGRELVVQRLTELGIDEDGIERLFRGGTVPIDRRAASEAAPRGEQEPAPQEPAPEPPAPEPPAGEPAEPLEPEAAPAPSAPPPPPPPPPPRPGA